MRQEEGRELCRKGSRGDDRLQAVLERVTFPDEDGDGPANAIGLAIPRQASQSRKWPSLRRITLGTSVVSISPKELAGVPCVKWSVGVLFLNHTLKAVRQCVAERCA